MVEADLFISYLTDDALAARFRYVVDRALSGRIELLASSEVYDDVISALRSQRIPMRTVGEFVRDMRTVPHITIPVTLDVAATAVELYLKHGGSRKLHYFDSFHVATSQMERLPLLTSDKYIIAHGEQLEVKALDVRRIQTTSG